MSNMDIVTLQGVKVGDMKVKIVDASSDDLGKLAEEGTYTHGIFDTFEMNDLIEFDLIVTGSAGRRRSRLNADSVHKVESSASKSNGEDHEGWESIEGVRFSPEEIRLFNLVEGFLNKNQIYNVWADGPSGYGKTSRAEALAKTYEMNIIEVNCGVLKHPTDIYGYMTAPEGNVQVKPSSFAGRVQEGNAVVYLDEITRTPASTLNGLLSILDYRRRGSFFDYEVVVGPKVLFIATANQGPHFTGTFEKDAALRNRFASTIVVGPPPVPVEIELLQERHVALSRKHAEKIIYILSKLRADEIVQESGLDVTTRTALNIAQLVEAGATIVDAFQYSVCNPIYMTDPDVYKNVRDRVLEMA